MNVFVKLTLNNTFRNRRNKLEIDRCFTFRENATEKWYILHVKSNLHFPLKTNGRFNFALKTWPE